MRRRNCVWHITGCAIAAMIALVPGTASATSPQNINFCALFQGIVENPLVASLGEDLENFIALFDPELADINGEFVIDDSGENLLISVFGNGIKDATNEFGLMQRILADVNYNGPVSHNELHAAWTANFNNLKDNYMGNSFYFLANVALPGLTEILAAYITLGDGEFTVTSSPSEQDPDAPIVVSGTGSFGFAGAFCAVIDYFAREELGTGFANPNLVKGTFTTFPELTSTGDADGDGFTNVCESRAFPRTKCADNSGNHYVVAALDAAIEPVGCYETVYECEIGMDNASVIPATDQESSASLKFEIWENTETDDRRYILSGLHTSGNILVDFAIHEGAAGEVGNEIIDLGVGLLPVEVELTDDQFLLLQLQETYLQLTTAVRPEGEGEQPPLPPAPELRGQFTCDIPLYEGEVIACEATLDGAQTVPPSGSLRVGTANVFLLPDDNRFVGSFTHNIFSPTTAHLGEGAPGVDNGDLIQLGNAIAFDGDTGDTRPSQFNVELTANATTALLSGNAFVEINTEGFPTGAIRGQLACDFIAEGEGTVEGEGEGGVEGEGEGGVEGEGEGGVEGEGEGGVEGEGEGNVEGEGEGGGLFDHDADGNNDGDIDLGELLRVIQFFNTPTGFHCDPTNPEDGFATGPGDRTCTPHSADYLDGSGNPGSDFDISLTELLRIVQFFNIGYYACPGEDTEDGYCAGPPPAN